MGRQLGCNDSNLQKTGYHFSPYHMRSSNILALFQYANVFICYKRLFMCDQSVHKFLCQTMQIL